jgi:hypothetical protein
VYQIKIQLFEYNILKKKISFLSECNMMQKDGTVIIHFSDKNSLGQLRDVLFQFVHRQGCSTDFTPNSPVNVSLNLITEIDKLR